MTKKKVFVDTGAWLALADRRDHFHTTAKAKLDDLDKEKARFATTNLVIHETAVLLSRRASRDAAIRFLDTAYQNEHLTIIHSDEITERKAYDIFRKYTDQDFSIADCVSFCVMKELKLTRAFTFDKHFTIMGFELV